MRKLADVRENMDELWVVEVYDTIEDADDFWGEKYETIERAVYLVNEDDDASDILHEYTEKYKDCKGYTVSVTRLDENLNYNGFTKI